MTNEECIKILKSKLDGNTDTSYEWCECIRLAIKALEFMDKLSKRDIERFNEMEYTKGYNKGWEDGRKALEQQPCEDTISRKAVNSLIDELARAISDERCYIPRGRATSMIMQDIFDLPPVTPQPKVGSWIRRDYWSEGVGMGESYGYYYQCSECKETIQGGYVKCDSKYCPNCGAKMR